jgi:anaerobic selenocysteine-containing dehydrogenase
VTKKKDLGLGNDIVRRDFLQGAAIAVTMGSLAPELAAAADAEKAAQDAPDYYPPTRLARQPSRCVRGGA